MSTTKIMVTGMIVTFIWWFACFGIILIFLLNIELKTWMLGAILLVVITIILVSARRIVHKISPKSSVRQATIAFTSLAFANFFFGLIPALNFGIWPKELAALLLIWMPIGASIIQVTTVITLAIGISIRDEN